MLLTSGWRSTGLPRLPRGSLAHSTAKQTAQSFCQICLWWAEGCPPRGDGPVARSRAGRAPAGTCTSVPSASVLPGTVTQLVTKGNTPASAPGTNIQSSATNSKKTPSRKPPLRRSLRDNRFAETHLQRYISLRDIAELHSIVALVF